MSTPPDSLRIQDASQALNIPLSPGTQLYILLGHFQPLKPSGNVRRLGQKLLKKPPAPKYENVHFSQVEGVFLSEFDAERRMRDLVTGHEQTAPHSVFDPSTQEVGRGFQIKTTTGLQSYWIVASKVAAYEKSISFGATVIRRSSDRQGSSHKSDESTKSSKESKPATKASDESKLVEDRCEHESVDRGLIDGRRIDRNSEQIINNMDRMGILPFSK
ncbi:hypothetical protein PRZ48_006869 [Zasmidium cellare]|uniref:Uncharacterized protein n=1 Tax=Zasmidium cellare TaxID=395010 RepID=A0ABR0EIN5_ZASCE|nr:hypothetical protein PRZ48_006869 [Zasmidium cellare]